MGTTTKGIYQCSVYGAEAEKIARAFELTGAVTNQVVKGLLLRWADRALTAHGELAGEPVDEATAQGHHALERLNAMARELCEIRETLTTVLEVEPATPTRERKAGSK